MLLLIILQARMTHDDAVALTLVGRNVTVPLDK